VNNTDKNFGDVMSRVYFLQIFWMMHVGNNITEESNPTIKRTKKVRGVIEYIEKVFQEYFSLYALVAPTFRAKQLAWWLCGDLKSLDDMAAEIFLNTMTGNGSWDSSVGIATGYGLDDQGAGV
jgi:hypothetical protein